MFFFAHEIHLLLFRNLVSSFGKSTLRSGNQNRNRVPKNLSVTLGVRGIVTNVSRLLVRQAQNIFRVTGRIEIPTKQLTQNYHKFATTSSTTKLFLEPHHHPRRNPHGAFSSIDTCIFHHPFIENNLQVRNGN
jgi:hypothetical protein